MIGNAPLELGLAGRRASLCGPWLHRAGLAQVWRRPGEAPMWVVQDSGVEALVQRIVYSALWLLTSSFPTSAAPRAIASPTVP